MRVIALTGGIGCGKSTASAFFQKLGIPCIDADSDEQMHSIIDKDPELRFLLASKPYKRISAGENLDQSVEEFCDWLVSVDLARNR